MLPELPGGSGACGQDRLVAELLGSPRGGFFVDVGANDGVTISNTFYLEKELGWRGLAIEPIPRICAQLRENRRCEIIHGCVTPRGGTAEFVEVVGHAHMLSTLAEHNRGLTARRLRRNVRRFGNQLRTIEVPCHTLPELLRQRGVSQVDFLSLDVEGGELEILRSLDFEATPVRCVSVENNAYDPRLRSYLESQGFVFAGTFKIDEIYLYGGPALRHAAAA
jgi:FkbM family methyltransferase